MKINKQNRWLLLMSVLALLFFVLDLVLLFSWYIIQSDINLKESLVSKVHETKQVFLKTEEIDLDEDFSPIVFVYNRSYLTPQESVWLEVSTSKEITALNEDNAELMEISLKGSLYKYAVKLEDIKVGQSDYEFDIQFGEDVNIEQLIEVERYDIGEFHYWDLSEEEIMYEADELNVIVDRQRTLRYDYVPDDLVDLNDYEVPQSLGEFKVREVLVDNLEDMVKDAKEEGIELVVISGYRSYFDQLDIYKARKNLNGEEYTDKSVARPGHSEHQLGTAVDFTSRSVLSGKENGFTYSQASAWLSENAHRYGFVLSYPPGSSDITGYISESWHYRYVGEDLAEEIFNSEEIPVEYLINLETD